MSLEQTMTDSVTAAVDVTKASLKLAEGTIKKAWSVLEAASEKQGPSEYLSQQGVNAMQGKGQ